MKYTKKLPKAYFQFRALRECWKKSTSPMKNAMIEMLTESMNEVVEIYKLELEYQKEVA